MCTSLYSPHHHLDHYPNLDPNHYLDPNLDLDRAHNPSRFNMPFGLRTWVVPGNHVLDGGPDPPWEGAILRGKGRPIVKYRDTLWSSVHKWLNRW